MAMTWSLLKSATLQQEAPRKQFSSSVNKDCKVAITNMPKDPKNDMNMETELETHSQTLTELEESWGGRGRRIEGARGSRTPQGKLENQLAWATGTTK